MPDALRLLAPMTWRGVQYPIAARNVSFRHEGIEHTVQYRDWEFVEMLGAHGLTFKYTIPMRESIAKGPYKNLFTEGLPKLFNDMVNRDPATLKDPIFGEFRCTPNAFEDTTDVLKRCGDDVQIELKHTPELAEQDPAAKQLSLAGLTSDAAALDKEVAQANWGQEPSPEPSVDPLQAANGVLTLGAANVGKFNAKIDDYISQMQALESSCDKLEDPANWGIRSQARSNRESAIRLRESQASSTASRLKSKVVTSNQLLSLVAKDTGASIGDLLKYNPSLARTAPMVRAGTVVVWK